MVFWIIGLAGAGKTTIAKAVYAELKAKHPSTVLLDGDAIREIMGGDLGFTLEDRRKNGWRICRMCKYLDDQGINVVCATLSQFHEQQAWNREHLNSYYEVFVDVEMEELIRRDQKGLYSGALAGKITNVVGVDMPFPPPEFPDLVLKNSESLSDFSPFVKKILAGFEEKSPNWKNR
ncbi:adenylyl-sulfate kinase [Rhodoferax saidenbachensis]|uniref:Adenylylsulfate kinase-like enzyme n=1 Tax=Rhodoferax saidenbachensis TaxID=1484693 RepID=A0ABU1ZKH0_9BURK|nr:adenylyl-sulfate kinase [Rhodoferax saidenbachensis]MDR7306043.1 adenylylsulfate kinase-like enzyme [Rhodoferax saidenbachensis]